MRRLTLIWTAVLTVAAFGFARPASAQVNTEPPGVARISLINGDVSMQRGDSGDTSAVDLNTPLVAGDKVFTGPQSRAEIQLDWANMLRLDENAQADIATLDRTRIQVQLAQGLAFFSVLKGSETDVEIDTPNVAINPRREGRYRIEVLPSGDTLVTVREGEADVSTPDGSTPLKKNELITARGTGSDVQFQIARAPGSDEFDRWNSDRDRLIANAESYRRTNRYYTGANDLDAYGRWDRVPDYGYVWVPRVAVGWAPYRHGRWVWTSYWGWTWTADEPWGWAPYHYGRWFVHRGNWVWWPGPVTPIYRPVYAPAYVSFFGFGSHSGFSVGVSFGGGFGSIGWLPAGPCDYVNPWWGSHRNNFNVVNVTNITNVYNVRNINVIAPLRGGNHDSNVHNMLVNNQVRYGLSTVDADNFGHGRANVRTVSAGELRQGHFMTGNVPVVPTRESLRTSDRTVVAGASRPQSQARFFSRRVPSKQRESFSDESARLQQAIGRDERSAPSAAGPGNRTGGFGNRNGNSAAVNSQRQAPQAPQQAQTPAPSETRREPSSGWRRFGGGQPASGNSQGIQREPVLRAPRQTGSTFESAQNRANTQKQTPPPAADRQRPSSSTSSTPPRANSQRMAPANPERPATQNRAPNQDSVNRGSAASSPAGGRSGWQQFSATPRNGNQAGTPSSPRSDSRPRLELNRPILQPRPFGGAVRSAPRPSAPSSNQRVAPAPRSAPQRSAPSSAGSRPAPQSSNSNSRGRSSESSRGKR
jgi:pyruvate/2-oxoglutarate dehydrogenase complex dihydrolipoamide acyltransferase (E2) component